MIPKTTGTLGSTVDPVVSAVNTLPTNNGLNNPWFSQYYQQYPVSQRGLTNGGYYTQFQNVNHLTMNGQKYLFDPSSGNFVNSANSSDVQPYSYFRGKDHQLWDKNNNMTDYQAPSFMDQWGGTIGLGLNAANGLLNYFNGQEQLAMQKDMFEYQQALANTNLWNQAKMINNRYDMAARIAAAMEGNISDDGNTIGFTSAEVAKKYAKDAESKHVKDHIS